MEKYLGYSFIFLSFKITTFDEVLKMRDLYYDRRY